MTCSHFGWKCVENCSKQSLLNIWWNTIHANCFNGYKLIQNSFWTVKLHLKLASFYNIPLKIDWLFLVQSTNSTKHDFNKPNDLPHQLNILAFFKYHSQTIYYNLTRARDFPNIKLTAIAFDSANNHAIVFKSHLFYNYWHKYVCGPKSMLFSDIYTYKCIYCIWTLWKINCCRCVYVFWEFCGIAVSRTIWKFHNISICCWKWSVFWLNLFVALNISVCSVWICFERFERPTGNALTIVV